MVGYKADPDKAAFPAVDLSTEIGAEDRKIKMKVPFFTGALGSTEIAGVNWEGAAIDVAICGAVLVCGENMCGMDVDSTIENGKVVCSPDLENRVKLYKNGSMTATVPLSCRQMLKIVVLVF